jgi:hypothetical protein
MVRLAKLQTPGPVIGLSDIHQLMEAPGKLQDPVSAVMNHPCRHVKGKTTDIQNHLLLL